MRKGAHVAGALHIVLPAQRIDANSAPPEIAGRHCEIGDGHDRRGALAVFGDAEAVINRRIAACGVKTPRAAHEFAGTPVYFSTASGLLRSSETKAAQS